MAPRKKPTAKTTRYRSAITGKYVTKKHARRNARTTVRETDKRK